MWHPTMTANGHFDRISIDPAVCHGKPVIKGTRVPISAILGAIAGGDPIPQIAADYGVAEEDVRAAVGYANDIVRREEHYALRAKAT